MRETFNIFYYLKIKDFDRVYELVLLFYRKQGYYTRKDSWYGLIEITICKIFGHKHDYSKISLEYGRDEIYCKRCKTYIKTLSYKELKQKIREQKLKNILK